jgi:hypothetical protein
MSVNKFYVSFLALLLTACGGSGSETSTTVSVATTQSVPPPSNPPSTQVSTCTNPYKSDYPDVYRGPWPIPTPNNKFDTSFIRGVSFKDYYVGNQAWRDKGTCTSDEYTKLMYTLTLDKMKSMNADQAWIYQYGPWADGTKSIWTMDKDNYQIPETMLTWIVNEARKRNIKINLVWQFHNVDAKGNTMFNHGDTLSKELMTTVMESHKQNMIEMAKYAESVGINAISADWNALSLGGLMTTHRELYVTKMVETVDAMRTHYRGKISFGQTLTPVYDERLFSKLDFIHISLNPILSDIEFVNFGVENVKAATMRHIRDRFYQVDAPAGVKLPPVEWVVSVQSRDKYFKEGWVEDGFCVTGTNTDGTANNCIQKTYVTDFSVQAIGIEGIFQAIKEQTYFKTYGVDLHTSFWLTDNVTPSPEHYDNHAKMYNTDFPNLSQSVRNKPAQDIVKHWFSR